MPGVIIQLVKRTRKDGETLRLLGSEFLVGRDPDSSIRLATDVASRRHARLSLESDGWYVHDLESANGTFVNGSRIRYAALRPLDEIVLGEGGARVRIVALDPAPPMASKGGEATRILRLAPRRGSGGRKATRPAPPKRERPKRKRPAPARTPAAPGPPPPPPASGRPGRWLVHPIGALLGLVFGLLTAEAVWGASFPYLEVSAPVLWVMAAVGKLAPEILGRFGPWSSRLLLAAYFAAFGFALQRPIRRILLILVLAAAHGAAVFLLRR
jgi:hypothetical protein